MGINEIEKKALEFAESKERAGCSYFNGLYRGYIAGYEACEGKETPDDNSNCIEPAVIKSVCDCPLETKQANYFIRNWCPICKLQIEQTVL